MAFRSAAGYGNLPNGVFAPILYAKEAQKAFRKQSIIQDIASTEYIGELNKFGDSVSIVREPDVQIQDYMRGQQVRTQDLIDEQFTLLIDQARVFAFKMDDLERMQANLNWMEMASNRAGYKMKDAIDAEVIAYLTGYKPTFIGGVGTVVRTAADIPGTKAVLTSTDNELLLTNILKKGDFGQITTASAGDHSVPVKARLPGATAVDTATVSPFDIISRMATKLDLQNVPTDGRWIIIDPNFKELMREERSVMFERDEGSFTNGLVVKRLHGFRVYESNNMVKVGTGPDTPGTANQNSNFGVLVAGHDSALVMAENISKVEKLRDQDSFADVVRGLHVFGRKNVRPEAIVTCKWNKA